MSKKNLFSDLLPKNMDEDSFLKKKPSRKEAPSENQPVITIDSNPAISKKPKVTKQQEHYHGHRDRMKDKLLSQDAEFFADYELVEMLLFLGIPRRDVKPLAKDLLNKYKTLPALVHADYKKLMSHKGMTKNAVFALKIIKETSKRMMKREVIGQTVLNNWNRLIDYLYATMAEEKIEHFRILFLDRKNNLIADEIQQTGTVDNTAAYPREIVKQALHLSATALILVHNHPSGDPNPSDADVDTTKQIIDAAKALDIVVHDHIIVSKSGYFSFKNEGLI